MDKKVKLPSLVSILILTLVTAVIWVSFNVYRSVTKKPSPSVDKEISDPLTPALDQNTIKDIESSIFLTNPNLPQLQTAATIAPTPSPSASPSATPAATTSPEASPATESASVQ